MHPNIKWLLYQYGISYVLSANRLLAVLGSDKVFEEEFLTKQWQSLAIHDSSVASS